jgi:hypothetical protein
MGENLLDHHWIFDAAMIRPVPPQAGQVLMSMPKTRIRRCAQIIAARPASALAPHR